MQPLIRQSPSLSEMLANAPQSESARRAIEHYQRTGCFRTEDLQLVLGSIRGVDIGSASITSRAEDPNDTQQQ